MSTPNESAPVAMGSAPAPGRVPDFFIIGHHKSGTTALYEMLRQHPQIFMPDLKEPRFFASDLRPQFEPRRGDRLPQTWTEYLALFAEAGGALRAGEASPAYLRSSVAAAAIAAAQPAARCIAILREPASFVRSLHLQLVQEHVESEQELGRAIANERVTVDGRALLRYSDHVHYVEQLRRFDAVFPPEQLLVLIYDDFRRDNETTVRRVLRFLEVDEDARIEMTEANPTVRVRSLRLDDLVRRMYGQGPLIGPVKSLVPRRVRRTTARMIRRRVVYGAPKPMDERVMEDLRRRYAPEVEALSDYLDRDLVTLWGYDKLG
jgi:hypothetical protein